MKNIHLIPTDKLSRLYEFGGEYHLQIKSQENFRSQHIYITNDLEIKEGDWFYNIISLKPEPFKACENGDGYVNCNKYSHYRIDCKKIILTTDQDLIKDGVQAIDDEFLEWFVKNPSCERVEVKIEFIQTPDNLKDGFYYKIIIPQEEDEQEEEEVECNMCDSLMSYDEENGIYICTNSECTRCYEEYEEEPKQETIENIAESKWSLKKAQEFAIDKFKSKLSEGTVTWELILEVLKIGVLTGHKFGAKWQAERSYNEAIEFTEWIRIKDFQTASKDNWIGLNMKYYTTEELFEQFKKK